MTTTVVTMTDGEEKRFQDRLFTVHADGDLSIDKKEGDQKLMFAIIPKGFWKLVILEEND